MVFMGDTLAAGGLAMQGTVGLETITEYETRRGYARTSLERTRNYAKCT
jgi:hypothetical protein